MSEQYDSPWPRRLFLIHVTFVAGHLAVGLLATYPAIFGIGGAWVRDLCILGWMLGTSSGLMLVVWFENEVPRPNSPGLSRADRREVKAEARRIQRERIIRDLEQEAGL